MTDYTDLVVRIGVRQAGQDSYPVEATLEDGSFFFGGQFQIDEQVLSDSSTSEEYGRHLFEALFSANGPIRDAYDQALGMARAQSDEKLRLRLWIDPDAAELHAVRLCAYGCYVHTVQEFLRS